MIDKKILAHFKKDDPIIYKQALLINLVELPKIDSNNFFRELCDSIVSQQLSGKAASTIFNRFLDLFPDKNPTPEKILEMSDDQLRTVGLSRAKAAYIKDLATRVIDGTIELSHLQDLDDETVIKELITVKGIGRWTAEMFLLFTLQREDIFSAGDLGLMNGIKKLYGLDKPNTEELSKVTEKWKPYRSFASRLLWKSLEI